FFQAEDGIRDFHVTGVQTCALPIYLQGNRHDRRTVRGDLQVRRCQRAPYLRRLDPEPAEPLEGDPAQARDPAHPAIRQYQGQERSEERRVGKEWRGRWKTYR